MRYLRRLRPVLTVALLVALASGSVAEPPAARGSRLLAIAITPPLTEDPSRFWDAYAGALDLGIAAGMDLPGMLTFGWSEVERSGLFGRVTYRDAMSTGAVRLLAARKLPAVIALVPFSTAVSLIPEDLRGRRLDDPAVIARFVAFIDWVYAETGELNAEAIVFGSEFDVHLALEAAAGRDRWAELDGLVAATRAHVKSLPRWAGVPFALEATFGGLTGPYRAQLQHLNRHADIVGASYYPLSDTGVRPPDVMGGDLDRLAELYPGRQIDLYQYGYPSSPRIGSSLELQRQFVANSFAMWDARRDRVRLMTFTWLYDVQQVHVDEMRDATLGDLDPGAAFAAFLSSLGLHGQRAGSAKPAFRELRDQMRRRGWPVR